MIQIVQAADEFLSGGYCGVWGNTQVKVTCRVAQNLFLGLILTMSLVTRKKRGNVLTKFTDSTKL